MLSRNNTTPDYQQIFLYFIIYVARGALFWLSDGLPSIIIFGATALVQMTVTVVYSRIVQDRANADCPGHILSATSAVTAIGYSFAARGCESALYFHSRR